MIRIACLVPIAAALLLAPSPAQVRVSPTRSASPARSAPRVQRSAPSPRVSRTPARSSPPRRSAPVRSTPAPRRSTPVRSYTPPQRRTPVRSYTPPSRSRSYTPPRRATQPVRSYTPPSRTRTTRSGYRPPATTRTPGSRYGSRSTGSRTTGGNTTRTRTAAPRTGIRRWVIGGASRTSTDAIRARNRAASGDKSSSSTRIPPITPRYGRNRIGSRRVDSTPPKRSTGSRSGIGTRRIDTGSRRTGARAPIRTGDRGATRRTPSKPPIAGRYDGRRAGGGTRMDRIGGGTNGPGLRKTGTVRVAPEPRRSSRGGGVRRGGKVTRPGPRRGSFIGYRHGHGYDHSYGRHYFAGYYRPFYYDCYWYWPRYSYLTYWFPSWCRYYWRSYWSYCWLNSYGSLYSHYAAPYYCYSPTYLPASSIVYQNTYVLADEPAEEEPVGDTPDPTPEGLARYYVELGDLYFKTRRYMRAAEAYTRAIRLVESDGSLRFVLADAWFAAGEYDKAAYAIRQGLHLDPALAEADVDKRDYYGFKEDFAKQLKKLREHLGTRPFDTQARLVLAYNLRFSQQLDEAKVQLEKLAEHLPGDRAVELLLAGIATLAEAEKADTKGPATRKRVE